MNTELMKALDALEEEKKISKSVMINAIKDSLKIACENHYGKNGKYGIEIDPVTGEYKVYAEKEVVEQVTDSVTQISLPNALMITRMAEVGGTIDVPIHSKDFGRIATQNAKNVILQKIREAENKVVYTECSSMIGSIVTGTIERFVDVKGKEKDADGRKRIADAGAGEEKKRSLLIKIGNIEATMSSGDWVENERYTIGKKIKVLVQRVIDGKGKGPRIIVSRSNKDFVKRLFEAEVTEIQEGIVEIKSLSREAGSRTKIAVWSKDEKVDAVGACIGMNSSRVNAVLSELNDAKLDPVAGGEKIDIINWSENAAVLIENALSPATKIICVSADEEAKKAVVVVSDAQLSLAIGKNGQNARLAAKLTGYKIDIKSESQAREEGFLDELDEAMSIEEE